jgi:hypothetical protein
MVGSIGTAAPDTPKAETPLVPIRIPKIGLPAPQIPADLNPSRVQER